MAITREQVAEAAEEIQAQGVEPTYINVRERLKSGSFSTIQKYLKEWRSGEAERKPDAAEIPELLRDALRRFGLEVWRAAGVWVKDELEGARKDFERRVIEHQAEAEKAAATVDALQVELNKAIGERDRLRGELQTARAALATAEGGLVEARAQLKRETKRSEDLSQRVIGEEAKAQALLAQVAELQRLREESQAARAAAAAEGALLEARTQLERQAKRNEDLSQRVIAEAAKAQALAARVEELEAVKH